jgi:hypothetical protein
MMTAGPADQEARPPDPAEHIAVAWIFLSGPEQRDPSRPVPAKGDRATG